jgi:predicted MFS family arabinose efflux permease
LTNPLSTAGARTLFPLLVPKELWERANGLDSSGHVLATLVGAPLAGAMVGLIGGEWALAAAGVLFIGAALVMLGLPDPAAATESHGNVLQNAWLGLKYVARNPTLRGLAFTLSFINFGWGVLDIAVPVLVLGRLHQGPATVGYLWGVLGAAGLISALLAGRVPTLGRERQIMLGGIFVSVVAMATLPFATSVVAVGIALFVMGLANGPFDISFFTLRQRRTPPAWFGRAFAVSMSVNFVGTPIGSALAGTLIERSVDVALWTAVAVVLVAAIFPMLTIPATDQAAAPAKAAT